MSIFCLKMFKNRWKFSEIGQKSAKLQAIVNKHLNILTYLTKMSKIGENLWTIYKIHQKLAKIRRKFAKIHKSIRKIGTWYTGIPPHRYMHGIPVYALVYRYTPMCFILLLYISETSPSACPCQNLSQHFKSCLILFRTPRVVVVMVVVVVVVVVVVAVLVVVVVVVVVVVCSSFFIF